MNIVPRRAAPADVVRAAGTSSSGSAGTVVAELAATAGRVLTGWTVFASNGAAGTSQLIITYDDLSTVTQAIGSTLACSANAGGAITPSGVLTASTDLPVKKLRVETTGVGVTARAAAIAALEVNAS